MYRKIQIHGISSSNQPPSVAPRELVALRLERVCSGLFTPIHLQIQIDNFFGIAEFRCNVENGDRGKRRHKG